MNDSWEEYYEDACELLEKDNPFDAKYSIDEALELIEEGDSEKSRVLFKAAQIYYKIGREKNKDLMNSVFQDFRDVTYEYEKSIRYAEESLKDCKNISGLKKVYNLVSNVCFEIGYFLKNHAQISESEESKKKSINYFKTSAMYYNKLYQMEPDRETYTKLMKAAAGTEDKNLIAKYYNSFKNLPPREGKSEFRKKLRDYSKERFGK